MKNKDMEILEVYRNVSGFTLQALEKSISDLRKGIGNSDYNMKTTEILKDRLEKLEEWMIKIELDF